MRSFIEYSLGLVNWQWYRRWRGGHWERCWVDICWGYVWLKLDHEQAAASAIRRYSTMEKLIECEDWPLTPAADARDTRAVG